jgi:cytochrome c556
MRDAAARIREACEKKDYEAARAAASELKKSCDACHGDYRS